MAQPTTLGMILCEQVITALENGRRTLVGTFDELTLDEFPTTLPPFVVYVALTDGQGHIPLDLSVTDLGTDEQVLTETRVVQFADPLAVVHFRFRLRGLELPTPGQELFE